MQDDAALLYAAVVTTADDRAAMDEHGSDRDATFIPSLLGFGDRSLQKCVHNHRVASRHFRYNGPSGRPDDSPLNSRPLPPGLAATLLTLAFGLAGLVGQTANPSLTLLGRDGRRAMPLAMVADQEFVALDDLGSAFQLSIQESLGAITVSYKGKTIVLTPEQSLASVAGRLISLPAAPSHQGRRWLVPVEFISRALAPIYDTRLELRKPSRLLIIGEIRVPRLALRYDAIGVAGRLTIDATPRAVTTVSQDGDHITIKFDAEALDAPVPLFTAPAPPGLVQAVRLVEPTTLAVDLVQRFGGFKASTLSVGSTGRLVLDLTPPPVETTPAPTTGTANPPPAPAPGPPPELPPALGHAAASIRTIAIDPGHGGDDEGAKGANGVREKDLTLAVARRLRKVLESRLGVRVLLTRDDDRNVPIDERAALANNNKADLFVSLHANASTRETRAARRSTARLRRGRGRRRTKPQRCRRSAAASARSRWSRGIWRRRATSRTPSRSRMFSSRS